MKLISYLLPLSIVITIFYVFYQKATTPLSVQAYCELADTYKNNNDFEHAINAYKQALKQEPHNLLVQTKLGDTLCLTERFDEALELCRNALLQHPAHQLSISYNMAMTYEKIENYTQAIHLLKQIVQHKPNWALPHLNLAFDLLITRDLTNGLREYEWRWQATGQKKAAPTMPAWDGSDPNGKTILIYAEQGLGDTLQFIRYAKLLKEHDARVLVLPQKPLIPLLKLCPYIDHVIETDKVPPFDYHIATMSLPYACKTTVATIPASIPYLYAHQELIAYWHTKLQHDTNFKIGICWHGNPRYADQAHQQVVKAKSIPLHYFESLSILPNISLYSLQKMGGEAELNTINFKVHTFDGDFDNTHGRFMDTAAVIQNLDLIITIDSSVAHLAGALGKPVWLLVPTPNDWRWFLYSTDTPWYPNMRLFRQPTRGNWQQVMQDVAKALTPQIAYLKKRTT